MAQSRCRWSVAAVVLMAQSRCRWSVAAVVLMAQSRCRWSVAAGTNSNENQHATPLATIDAASTQGQSGAMALTLYYHPYSRAATSLWMLEEVGVDCELHYLDIMKGAHKAPEILELNPMGKLPILRDGDTVVTESAAIGLYLADRYAPGRLAPRLDDPARGTYYRWAFFAPSVIEPGSMAKAGGWKVETGAAGWGRHEDMLRAMENAVDGGEYLLGETFSMADVIFGATLRYMIQFEMLEARPAFSDYVARVTARPACVRADARNAAIAAEKGLGG